MLAGFIAGRTVVAIARRSHSLLSLGPLLPCCHAASGGMLPCCHYCFRHCCACCCAVVICLRLGGCPGRLTGPQQHCRYGDSSAEQCGITFAELCPSNGTSRSLLHTVGPLCKDARAATWLGPRSPLILAGAQDAEGLWADEAAKPGRVTGVQTLETCAWGFGNPLEVYEASFRSAVAPPSFEKQLPIAPLLLNNQSDQAEQLETLSEAALIKAPLRRTPADPPMGKIGRLMQV